jgi:hypothetical protein
MKMCFLIDCELSDAESIHVCLSGLEAHADIEFFRFPEDFEADYFSGSLTACWLATFPTHASLETFCNLMESIPFKQEDFIRIIKEGGKTTQPWTLSEFHKAVLVDNIFAAMFT